MPVLKRSAARPRCIPLSTRTIVGGWCAAFRMRSSTNMSKVRSPSMASFTPRAIPTNGVSVCPELVQLAAEPGHEPTQYTTRLIRDHGLTEIGIKLMARDLDQGEKSA